MTCAWQSFEHNVTNEEARRHHFDILCVLVHSTYNLVISVYEEFTAMMEINLLLYLLGVFSLFFMFLRPSPRFTRIQFLLTAAVAIASFFYGISHLESKLEDFYIFKPDTLHALSLKAIDQHGNNTRAIVDLIVSELQADPNIAQHLNLDEEWIFNNAGGAMGAMYIIHASKTHHPPYTPPRPPPPRT